MGRLWPMYLSYRFSGVIVGNQMLDQIDHDQAGPLDIHGCL